MAGRSQSLSSVLRPRAEGRGQGIVREGACVRTEVGEELTREYTWCLDPGARVRGWVLFGSSRKPLAVPCSDGHLLRTPAGARRVNSVAREAGRPVRSRPWSGPGTRAGWLTQAQGIKDDSLVWAAARWVGSDAIS